MCAHTKLTGTTMNNVKQRVWNGTINTRILFKDAEYLLQIHRNSYFPLYFSTIAQFFSHVTGIDLHTSQVWLEYEDVPLKWNMPVGVLYDLLFLPSMPEDKSFWTLHLRHECSDAQYPKDDIIPFQQTENGIDYKMLLTQVVINHLKQSCYVMNGNSRAMMSLSEDDTKTLWNAIVQHDYGMYTSIIKKVLPKQMAKRVPIKLYLAGSSTLIQAPVFPTKNQDEPTTLRSVLFQWFPEAFANNKAKAFIHGIDVDALFDVPIYDVWSPFRHLDNFLYIVVVVT